MPKINGHTAVVELIDFEQFRRLCPEIASLSFERRESPDFIVDQRIGIEHRRLYIQESENGGQVSESYERLIISETYAAYFRDSNPPVDVQFEFKTGNKYQKGDRTEITKSLCDFIKNNLLRTNEESRLRLEEKDGLHELLASIHIRQISHRSHGLWQNVNAGWALKGMRKNIQNGIDEKEEKYNKYLKNCKECWLLLACGHEPSGFMHPTVEDLEHIYVGRFSRLYLLEKTHHRVHSLKIAPPNALSI